MKEEGTERRGTLAPEGLNAERGRAKNARKEKREMEGAPEKNPLQLCILAWGSV